MCIEIASRCRPSAIHHIAAAGAPLHVVGPLTEIWSPVDMDSLLADAVRGGRLDVVRWACETTPARADTLPARGERNAAPQREFLSNDSNDVSESSGETWTGSDDGAQSANDDHCDLSCSSDCPWHVAWRTKAEHERQRKERRERCVRAAWGWRRAQTRR
ncbi:hypothetical protein pneo_cds_449 [Pandoravirus neocaledonia]|uniref:Uncharacterized protein n=1 Tax=Pandoravirus neocaledonia TaxID=2107708 RepID=A0A2U7UC90_9VIRU|nr:hypothetical protein pneo_cds_449 [Pandoravirus neocaledonia]AVK76056.1 hypothetical protein pneo_cds_449 [Pandoravirus neocaledonia]